MILWSILLVKLLFTNAEMIFDDKYCDPATPINTDIIKLIFYDVNPSEGFNLRRDVYMRLAIMLAESQKAGRRLSWRLVLPPWYNLYHWKSRVIQHKPIPWSNFFQIDALKAFTTVLEINETFTEFSNNGIEIDVLYILQNYKNTFEDGNFEEKWERTENCYYDGEFWGYKNVTVKETVCIKYQGKASILWELIAIHPYSKTVMFSHAEIPLHDSYGTKVYWDCRKSMQFSNRLQDIADEYITQELGCDDEKCGSYLAVHWRRQDFAWSRGKQVPSPEGTASQIHRILNDKHLDVDHVFIATDATEKEINKLKAALSKLTHELKMFIPKESDADDMTDGDYAIVDQIICSRAAYFVGTHESTFTYRIQEEREILGFPTETTFNRLCPDSGVCEKPSQWTIVD